ncbi:MAG: hypothetical protein IPI49_29575 [Myxococcales bacterium]|nr:hypothetical protein [Myxococcales bacterium]
MRSILVLLMALAGACRFNFDAASGEGADAAPDGPPLPALVCSARVTSIPPVGANSDLAVTDRDEGYLAAWLDPSRGQTSISSFDLGRNQVGSGQVRSVGASVLAGLELRAERLWMVTATQSVQTLWSVALDLSAATEVLREDTVAGADPMGVGLTGSTLPIWSRGVPESPQLRLSYLTSAGEVAASAIYATDGVVTALSSTDYVDHVHLAWREASGRCVGADVNFLTVPTVMGATVISNDCKELRIVSGPPPHDPLVTAWSSAAGIVQIQYSGGTPPPAGGSEFHVTVGAGRAPRISFDGEAYWVAWLEGDVVQVARVDARGRVTKSSLPGFPLVGDGAFELVRRGISVDLVMLSETSLTFLRLCSP